MKKYLQNHFQHVISYDLITKTTFKNVFEITKITDVYLNIGFPSKINSKRRNDILLFFYLLTNKTPIIIKKKRKELTGCQIILRKKNIFVFLEKLIIFILPKIDPVYLNPTFTNILNLKITNVSDFFEFKDELTKFKRIPPINLSLKTNSTNYNELFILLNLACLVKPSLQK